MNEQWLIDENEIQVTNEDITEALENLKLDPEVVNKLAEEFKNNRCLFRSYCSRVSELHHTLDDLFIFNMEASAIDNIFRYQEQMRQALTNGRLLIEYFKNGDFERSYVSLKQVFYSVLKAHYDNKNHNAMNVDDNYILVMKYIFSEITLEDIETQAMEGWGDIHQIFIDSTKDLEGWGGIRPNSEAYSVPKSFTPNCFFRLIDFLSAYKLNSYQVGKICNVLIDDQSGLTVDDIFGQGEIVCDLDSVEE